MKTDLIFPHWMKDALCGQCDNPEIFFPQDEEQRSQAMRICRECPVWRECRQWGFSVDDRFAILGGLTKNQRSRMRNKRRKAVLPS